MAYFARVLTLFPSQFLVTVVRRRCPRPPAAAAAISVVVSSPPLARVGTSGRRRRRRRRRRRSRGPCRRRRRRRRCRQNIDGGGKIVWLSRTYIGAGRWASIFGTLMSKKGIRGGGISRHLLCFLMLMTWGNINPVDPMISTHAFTSMSISVKKDAEVDEVTEARSFVLWTASLLVFYANCRRILNKLEATTTSFF